MEYTVSKIARAAGVGIETIRFYEQEGLLDEPSRRPSGYRIYSDAAVTRIRFIQRAKQLGFTLREIRELIALDARGDAECGDLRARASEKLAVVEAKIADLERVRGALADVIAACLCNGPIRECPVMECLAAGVTEV